MAQTTKRFEARFHHTDGEVAACKQFNSRRVAEKWARRTTRTFTTVGQTVVVQDTVDNEVVFSAVRKEK